jgi:ketosteroid isomerase-like protein
MPTQNSVEIVNRFWREVWQARDPSAVDRLVADDFVLTSGGVELRSKAAFKQWVADFLAKIDGFDFHVVETFQSESGHRVASRWRITGRNNGFAGTQPCGSPIEMCGTAVWQVSEDGLLQHNWVERNALEVFRSLSPA